MNYQGMRNLAAAARQAGVPKFIRVSGLSGAFFFLGVNLVFSGVMRLGLVALGTNHPPRPIPPPLSHGHPTVGYSAFNPVTILLNLVVSFAVRWQVSPYLFSHTLLSLHQPTNPHPHPPTQQTNDHSWRPSKRCGTPAWTTPSSARARWSTARPRPRIWCGPIF